MSRENEEPEDDENWPLLVGEFKMMVQLSLAALQAAALTEARSRARHFFVLNGRKPSGQDAKGMFEAAFRLTADLIRDPLMREQFQKKADEEIERLFRAGKPDPDWN